MTTIGLTISFVRNVEPMSNFSTFMWAMAFIISALVTAYLFTANCYPEEDFDIVSKVTHIVDGDTIDLASGDRIRLSIANTPERGQDGYSLATKFTKNLCLGKDAKIDLDDGQKKGSYGRSIGLVYCGEHNLNEELIEGGYAVVWSRYCDVSEFSDLLCDEDDKDD